MNSTLDYSKERQDIWYELSVLFLDTEPSQGDLSRIVERLAASSFSSSELTMIMEDEVAPILHTNLLCVAGQWGMFDRDQDVIQPILARMRALNGNPARGWPFFLFLKRKFHMMNVEADWHKILDRVNLLRCES